ncbi:MAG: NUDIX domain-containing protein [Nanoarchaeota archaeon]|nr:NUDIX domain-containing protein [Nanoarchaeota archaeon]
MFKFLEFMKSSSSPEEKEVPIVVCYVMYKGELLLLERSAHVEFYRGWWNVVTGYWDGKISIEARVRQKLLEELSVTSDVIKSIRVGEQYTCRHFVIEKDWSMHPVFIELMEKPPIHLSDQHQAYRWVKPEQVKNFSVVPRVADGLHQLELTH